MKQNFGLMSRSETEQNGRKRVSIFLESVAGGLRPLLKNWSGMVGLSLTLAMVGIGVAAPVIAPRHYAQTDLPNRLEPPSLVNLFGTDELGRDVFSRVVYGAQIAIWIGLVVVGIEAAIGVSLGLIAGYYGKASDRFISALSDVIWALPPIVLALAVVTIIGPGLTQVVSAVAVVSWPPFSRVTRAKIQSLRNREFVVAAKSIGENDANMILRYLLPNVVPSLVILSTLTLPSAILSTTALSFLGFGAQPPSPDWGYMISKGMVYMVMAPWITTFPGIFLVLLCLGLNLLGDGLRDVLDPRLKI